MADELIKRKNLLREIDRVKLDDWIRAAKELGLVVTQPSGGSSHYAIRRAGFPPEDFRGFITNVYENLHRQDKPTIFKRLLRAGIAEDDLWRALGFKC